MYFPSVATLLTSQQPRRQKHAGQQAIGDPRARTDLGLENALLNKAGNGRGKEWQLTVGIEIHAQLNTEQKLFSNAEASMNDDPNSQVTFFDLAMPGSQPNLQKATLLPALRAALALNCQIQRISKFDRKHYFYHDQPAGYQITQYYEPFARNGSITLDKHDGIAPEDYPSVEIGIQQIQLEQDTAKTVQQPPFATLLDFNRVGQPLIEIITLPQLHHPQTASACVRKIQQVLQAVNSVTTGMEMGGLRADVNVSVRRKNAGGGPHAYFGTTGLGQRTEIKNLSSLKAVEDAVIAERDRQIEVLESGGKIEGETRGWILRGTETKKLRGKEGEVDYRYMPDPDLPPLILGQDLIDHLTTSLPMLPDEHTHILTTDYGLSIKDAKTLIALDHSDRLNLFYVVTSILLSRFTDKASLEVGKTTANWILHELGGLLGVSRRKLTETNVSVLAMASIIGNLLEHKITGRTAKQLLSMVFEGDERSVSEIISQENLELVTLSEEEYQTRAAALVEGHPGMAAKVRNGQVGKLQWFVGQMVRDGEGKVEAQKAAAVFRSLFGITEPTS